MDKEFAKKLAGYMVMCEAYLLAHPNKVDAQILYTDVNPDTLIHNSDYFLDLNNDGVVDFKLSHHEWSVVYYSSGSGWSTITYDRAEINVIAPGARVLDYLWSGASCSNNPIPLNQGDNVNGQVGSFYAEPVLAFEKKIHTFFYGNGESWTNWYGCFGNEKYLGLKLTIGGNKYYGWARLLFSASASTEFILKDYAVKLIPNTGILAGYISGCPAPTSPGTANLTNHSVKLTWTTQSGAIGYKVRIRKVGTTAWNNTSVNGNIGFKNYNGLTPNTNYEWQVKTVCSLTPVSQSPWISMQSFTTPLRLEDESAEQIVSDVESNELFIYPNPATNELYMLMNEAGDYEMKIYNMMGQSVAQQKITLLEDQSMTADISALPSGNYIVVVTGADVNHEGRFVKE